MISYSDRPGWKPVTKLITSATTTSIFTSRGRILAVVVFADSDGGLIHFTDDSAAAIDGLPDSSNKGVLDLLGTYPIPVGDFTGGLKVVTSGTCTTLVMSVFAEEPV
jgi:hypothetical protein